MSTPPRTNRRLQRLARVIADQTEMSYQAALALVRSMPSPEEDEPQESLNTMPVAGATWFMSDGVLRSVLGKLPHESRRLLVDSLASTGDVLLGVDGADRQIGIRHRDLDRNMVIFGDSGTGKSQLLARMMADSARAGEGLLFLDSTGLLSDQVAQAVAETSPHRAGAVRVIDWYDQDNPVAFNPLDVSSSQRVLPTAAVMVDAIMPSVNSYPRGSHYLWTALVALIEANLHLRAAHAEEVDVRLSLAHVPRFFADPAFRHLVMSLVSNENVRTMYDPEAGPYETMSRAGAAAEVSTAVAALASLWTLPAFSQIMSGGRH